MGKSGVGGKDKGFIDQPVMRITENIDAAFGPDVESVDGVHR
jgi:hypothetical protein